MICSNPDCQAFTDIDYDDSSHLGILCKKCREVWDNSCKHELEVIEKPEVPTVKLETFYPLTYPFLDEVKKLRANTTVESKELTAVANEYLAGKHYEDENIGIDFINNWIKKSKFKDVTIIWKLIRNGKQYSDFRSLLKHEATFRLLLSEAPLEYGLTLSDAGLVFLAKLG